MLRKLSALVAFFILTIFTVSAQTPPNNEIWYTTTDGKKISISFDTDDFVSHSYNNGRGVLKFRYSLTSIGWYSFYNCHRLKSIIIPNSVTEIVEYAFQGCSSLKSITIPNSVTSIGERVFQDCSSLTSITIPNSVTSIGEFAFSGCHRLKSITIPNSVTSIGEYAFYRCSSLTSVTIPNSVTWIRENAFCACSSLTSITIPNSVTSIERDAFSGCSSLTSITIPNSVTEIGGGAFEDCSSLKSITIPNSVTWLGIDAFNGCSSLTSITIPNSVTSIGNGAFWSCSSLTSITIPNSVTSIGDYAFSGCSSLTSITIPNSVKSIGERAFDGCSSLTSITIPESVTEIGSWAFAHCSSLTSIIIPNSVKGIGNGAFVGCSSLKSFADKFASSDGRCLIIDGKLIAYAPAGLTSYTIPNSVTSIKYSAFDGCSSLKNVKVSNKYCYDYFKRIGVSDITFAVSTLEEYEKAQKLGATKLAIDSNSKYASEDGLCLIDNGKLILFIGKDLTEYSIPEGVTSFRDEAFKDCSNLKSVKVSNKYCYDYFKDKVANIAFYGANASDDGRCLIVNGELQRFIGKGVTQYSIPEGVTSFREEAFEGCSNLKSVKVANKYCYDYFKDKVADIAFYGANASADGRCLIVNGELQRFIGKCVTQYSIPESVTSIEEAAFEGCSDLNSVKVANKYCYDYFKDKVADIAFYGANASADGRCLIVNGELQRFIGKGITEYTIPESVTSIGDYAFYGCDNLTSITIPNSVTSIGNYAFEGCDNLTSITCLATTPPAIGNLRIGETTMIYVPKEAVKAYKKDPNWSIYKKQIKPIK